MGTRDRISCRNCGTQVAFVQDHVIDLTDFMHAGFFNRLFNVGVSEDRRRYQVIDGKTLAHVHCVECGMILGWRLVEVPRRTRSLTEGRFYMRLDRLINWNGVMLLYSLFGGANVQAPNDQVGGANANQVGGANVNQVGGANNQVGGANANQVGGANDQVGGANANQVGGANNQVGGANEQVPNEQDLGANEQNAYRDGGTPGKRRRI